MSDKKSLEQSYIFHYEDIEFTDLNSLYEFLIIHYNRIEDHVKKLLSMDEFKEWLNHHSSNKNSFSING